MAKAGATPRKPQWKFRARLRRSAFGWRGSRIAITRIDEAVAEIRAVARRDPALAAKGAVLFLEKISPAVRDVDSSSGALGAATYSAVAAMVPIIASAPVDDAVRAKWLDRLFEAVQEDDPPYIESLIDNWGELCATPALASRWADDLLPTVRRVLDERRRGVFSWFIGTGICFSALFASGRHDELMALLALDPHPIWQNLIWGGRVLAARSLVDEAIAYVQGRAGINVPQGALARFAEQVLLHAGRTAEAYARYAIEANQAGTRLATFRAIAKKFPDIEPDRLLSDLIASTPGDEGKWFATARSLSRFDLALELARRSPCDPRTLIRAARDHLGDQPAFAAEAAWLALQWMALGHGYELTSADVLEAYRHARDAAHRSGHADQFASRVKNLLVGEGPSLQWMRKVLQSTGVSV